MTAPYDSKASAAAHVGRALRLVEQAQHLLEEACRELSPVVGGALQWAALGKLTDKTHAHWYRLDGWLSKNRGKLDLDEGTKLAEEKRADSSP